MSSLTSLIGVIFVFVTWFSQDSVTASPTFFQYQPYDFNRHLQHFRNRNYQFWHELYRSNFEQRPFLRYTRPNFALLDSFVPPREASQQRPFNEISNDIFGYRSPANDPLLTSTVEPRRTTRPRTTYPTRDRNSYVGHEEGVNQFSPGVNSARPSEALQPPLPEYYPSPEVNFTPTSGILTIFTPPTVATTSAPPSPTVTYRPVPITSSTTTTGPGSFPSIVAANGQLATSGGSSELTNSGSGAISAPSGGSDTSTESAIAPTTVKIPTTNLSTAPIKPSKATTAKPTKAPTQRPNKRPDLYAEIQRINQTAQNLLGKPNKSPNRPNKNKPVRLDGVWTTERPDDFEETESAQGSVEERVNEEDQTIESKSEVIDIRDGASVTDLPNNEDLIEATTIESSTLDSSYLFRELPDEPVESEDKPEDLDEDLYKVEMSPTDRNELESAITEMELSDTVDEGTLDEELDRLNDDEEELTPIEESSFEEPSSIDGVGTTPTIDDVTETVTDVDATESDVILTTTISPTDEDDDEAETDAMIEFILNELWNAALDLQKVINRLTDPVTLTLNLQFTELGSLVRDTKNKVHIKPYDADKISQQVTKITSNLSVQRVRSNRVAAKKQRLDNLAKLLKLNVENNVAV